MRCYVRVSSRLHRVARQGTLSGRLRGVEQPDEDDSDEYHESHDDGDRRFELQAVHDASHAQMRKRGTLRAPSGFPTDRRSSLSARAFSRRSA